ncbi:RT0821/Lpp0805 family surface protein [Hoeflea sp. G2-23]|uniref:RT0821/Lpp0805 family surface protein n=1 Tax=Hoeflea algicola TaxID=2983763 RepID=A0ABT3ZFD2_9HYPH|nr:RT0821/Lpp0805 family surface protein [Hoeflea algicola]MCY0150520.1 RT0821/Lpp0805 family surface protein [Hoeflea algicola]
MANDLTDADRAEKARHRRRALLALMLPILLGASGCMRSGRDAVSALSLDPMTTGSIAPLSADSEIMSDETVIGDLLGELTEDQLINPHPWSNALTGSAGVISDIVSQNDGATSCRVFQTTRHGFDGVALFNGRVCRLTTGAWGMDSFERAGS